MRPWLVLQQSGLIQGRADSMGNMCPGATANTPVMPYRNYGFQMFPVRFLKSTQCWSCWYAMVDELWAAPVIAMDDEKDALEVGNQT